MNLFRCCLLLIITFLCASTAYAYTFGQSFYSLQRFLDENPSQQPLIEQLSVRVSSQPVPLITARPATQKIALVMRGTETDVVNRAWLLTFKRRMQELNIDFRLDSFYVGQQPSVMSVMRTYQKIEQASFDYLVVDRIDQFNRPILERVLMQDQMKVIMLNLNTPIDAWRLHSPLIYIGIDIAKMMDRLASYINRELGETAVVDVLTVEDDYVNEARCQAFVNAMQKLGREVQYIYRIKDRPELARKVALDVMKQARNRDQAHFVFSCTPNLARGVSHALLANLDDNRILTNGWLGQKGLRLANNKGVIMVTVLEMEDKKAIATAESIKADIESRLLPMVYMESYSFLSQDMDQQTRQMILQQVAPYSASLWPH